MRYFDNLYMDYTDKEWLEGFLDARREDWSERANTEIVGLVEYVSAKHKAIIYDLALNSVVSNKITTKETRDFVIEASRALMKFLAKKLDNIDVVEEDLTSFFGVTHSILTSKNKLRYIGEPNHHSFDVGEKYSIIEVSNWFYNENELGYYLTNKDYNGDDSDYGTFYTMGTIKEKFEVLEAD